MKKFLFILIMLLAVCGCGNNPSNEVEQQESVVEANPYREKILEVNTLFDVGEANLTENDVVTIDNIDFYVLKRDADKALLMTKNIYESVFDVNGSPDYIGSTLQSFDRLFWSNNFSKNKYILDTKVEGALYMEGEVPENDAFTWDLEKENHYIPTQIKLLKVYSIQARDLNGYVSYFGWEPKTENERGFWTAIAQDGKYNDETQKYEDTHAFYVSSNGTLEYEDTTATLGQRPVMWVSLED